MLNEQPSVACSTTAMYWSGGQDAHRLVDLMVAGRVAARALAVKAQGSLEILAGRLLAEAPPGGPRPIGSLPTGQ